MKRFLFIGFAILINFTLFAQSSCKGLRNDTLRRYADSIIAGYETQGLKLYTDSMYDAAILKYTAASNFQYALLKKTHLFSYASDYCITMCNIAVCYYKMSCFYQSLLVLGNVSKKWYPKAEGGDENFNYNNFDWSKTGAFIKSPRIYAYLGFCTGDCDLASGQFDRASTTDFNGSLGELYITGAFPDNAILTYPYGINSYSYKSICNELGDYLKERGDSISAREYYMRSTNIDSAKIIWHRMFK